MIKKIKKLSKFLLICLFLGFSLVKNDNLINKIKAVYETVASEPKNKEYITDERKYLKTFYLLKKNLTFYQSSYLAFKNQAGQDNVDVWNKDFWGWRLPFTFYFWSIFSKTGGEIFNLFIIIAAFSLINSYLIAKKFISKKLAILAPLMLFPYFLNAILSTSFLFITWWALFFFLFGLVFFLYKQPYLSAIFFTFAVISREHFIISLSAMFAVSLLFKKQRLVFLIPIISFFLMILIHSFKVSSYVTLENQTVISQRLSVINKSVLLTTLSFSTNSYCLTSLRPSLVWIISSTLGLSFLIFKDKNKYYPLIAFMSFLPLFLSLSFMGKSIYHDYWGAMYVPLAGIFSLTVLKVFNDD